MTKMKKYSFGGCNIHKIKPPQTPPPKILNVTIPFEEALKLHLALHECLSKLNKYKMSSTAGRRAAMNLVIHIDVMTIAVLEDKLT